MTPSEATKNKNSMTLTKYNALKSQKNNVVSDLIKGDSVRIQLTKTFKKGTEPNYSDEVYNVESVYGKKVTLNNGDVIKRSALLKIPGGSVSSPTNVIHEANKEQRIQRRLNLEGLN